MDLNLVFRRLVMTQVLLGLIGFCIAEGNPRLLLLAGSIMGLSWYVAEGPTGRSLPNWILLLGVVAASIWLLVEIVVFHNFSPISIVGHFTIWMQTVQLFGRKNNHDYTLLLILSLLQMIGATVLSSAFFFSLMLGIYCLLALFTVLVFQLKATSDQVSESTRQWASPGSALERPKLTVGRGFRWQFRLLALGIGAICALAAMLAFFFLPRSTVAIPDLGGLTDSTARQTGFRDTIHLVGGSITPAQDPVLQMRLLTPPAAASPTYFYLRGAVLDHYHPRHRLWTINPEFKSHDFPVTVSADAAILTPLPAQTPLLRYEIKHRQKNLPVWFSLLPPQSLATPVKTQVLVNRASQQIKPLMDAPPLPTYTLSSVLQPQASVFQGYDHLATLSSQAPPASVVDSDSYARGWRANSAVLSDLTRQILRPAHLQRDPETLIDPQDLRIAQHLTAYLQDNFNYTLDVPIILPREDPILTFLQNRQGHCELFASTLAAMCRSLGMRARVITGFIVHEYNAIGGYYLVRAGDAHAWVEVYCDQQGWVEFDPTPPASLAESLQYSSSWHSFFTSALDYLDQSWQARVSSYDRSSQEQVITTISASWSEYWSDEKHLVGWLWTRIKQFFTVPEFTTLHLLILLTIGLAILLGVGILIHLWLVRRRRLAALQIDRLPRAQRRLLAKRLNFYLTMLDLLERHGHVRPAWQSPFPFAQALTRKDPLRFAPVLVLTELFYEVRFGYHDIDEPKSKLIRSHLHRLEELLATPGKVGGMADG